MFEGINMKKKSFEEIIDFDGELNIVEEFLNIDSSLIEMEKNKDKMKELVNETILQYIDIEKESEHSIDAISIGYSLLNLIKSSPYLLKFG